MSNHYTGRSKSFANLSDVSTVKDLEKPDNSFNKRRRVLMANKLSRRSCFYTWQNPKSMPLLALKEDDEEDGEVTNPTSTSSSSSSPSNYEDGEGGKRSKLQSRRQLVVKYQSCFSLTDLQEEPQ